MPFGRFHGAAARGPARRPEITAQDCGDGIDPGLRSSRASREARRCRRSRADTIAIPADGFDGVSSIARSPAPVGGQRRIALSCHPRANESTTAQRNQASQTLSPRPSMPTRFMPSFQSPLPNSGSPCAPSLPGVLDARGGSVPTAGRCAAETAGTNRRSCSLRLRAARLPGTRRARPELPVSPVTFDVMRDHEGQPQQIVGAERAHAHAGFGMPPMLHVAFVELARRRRAECAPRVIPGRA